MTASAPTVAFFTRLLDDAPPAERYALATAQMDREVNFVKLCAAAAEVTARAIANAIEAARR